MLCVGKKYTPFFKLLLKETLAQHLCSFTFGDVFTARYSGSKNSPTHHTSTTMFNSGYGVLRSQ